MYLILEGEIQFSTLEKYKQEEYFISKITTPDTAKVIQEPFYALSLEFTNDEIISVMLEIEGGFQAKNNYEKILNAILKLLNLNKDDNEFLQKI